MLAIFDNLGFSELLIVVVVAVLIFGKRLPEVASQAGMQIAKFRRSLQDLKNETGIDNDIRKIQREIQEAVPRDLSMGEMARIASLELEKRMKANEEPKAKPPDVAAVESGASAMEVMSPSSSTVEHHATKTHSAMSSTETSHPTNTHDASANDSSHHAAPANDAGHEAAATDSSSHDAGGHHGH
jgi:TatA/E family protein of Tat protein translocase